MMIRRKGGSARHEKSRLPGADSLRRRFPALLAAWLAVMAALLLSLPLRQTLPLAAAEMEADGAGDGASRDVPSGDVSSLGSLPVLRREDSGPLTAGITFSLTLYAGGTPALGFEGDLHFDAELLSFSSTESLLPAWDIYFTKSHFLLCPDTLETPLNAETPIPVCRFHFRIKEDAAPGSPFSVGLKNFTLTDGKTALSPGDPSFSGKCLPPDTGKARLRALSAGEYPLTPAFSADLFSYTVKDLPPELESLPLHYEPASDDLTVTTDFPPLSDGRTVLTLTVTAGDGSEAVYTVTALRRFGDGYLPSSEGRLQSLVPSSGILSPAFSPDVEDYILYLPVEYAGKTLTLLPVPMDENASAKALTVRLSEMEEDGGTGSVTPFSLACMAEDGSERRYTVTVMLLPPYRGTPPYVENSPLLRGTLEIVQTETGYLARSTLSRPDGRFALLWRFGGEIVGEGELLEKGDALQNGILTAVLTGRDGFAGELQAEVYLDGAGDISSPPEKPAPPDRMTVAVLCGGAALALVIGFFAGLPVGKRQARKKKKKKKK